MTWRTAWRMNLMMLRIDVNHPSFVLMFLNKVKEETWFPSWTSWSHYFWTKITFLHQKGSRTLLPPPHSQAWDLLLDPFLHFQDKVSILCLARQRSELTYMDARVHIHTDFSAILVVKRWQFDAVKNNLCCQHQIHSDALLYLERDGGCLRDLSETSPSRAVSPVSSQLPNS